MLSFEIWSSQAGPTRLDPFISSCVLWIVFCWKAMLWIDPLCCDSSISSSLAVKQQTSFLKFSLLTVLLSLQRETCHSFFYVRKLSVCTCNYYKISNNEQHLLTMAERGWMQSEAEQSSPSLPAGPMPFCWVIQHYVFTILPAWFCLVFVWVAQMHYVGCRCS